MTIVIGGAWPYANGSLHLGHVAALLPVIFWLDITDKRVSRFYMYQAVIVMVHPFLSVPRKRIQRQRLLPITIMMNLLDAFMI